MLKADAEILRARMPELEPALRASIRSFGLTVNDVDDILQNTWIRALRGVDGLRDSARLQPWLKTIARNEAKRWIQRNRDVRWQQLAHDLESVTPAEAHSVFEAFDVTIRRLASSGLNEANALPLALSLCFDWTPAEIATTMGKGLDAVYMQIGRARNKMRRFRQLPEMNVNEELRIKIKVIFSLAMAGIFPLSGTENRNVLLLEQMYSFLKITAMQYSDSPFILRHFMYYAFFMARVPSMSSLSEMFMKDRMGEWNRALWDLDYLRDAESAYQRWLQLEEDPNFRSYYQAVYLIYAPRHNNDVDWSRVLLLLQDCARRHPLADVGLQARVIGYMHGARAGAQFFARYCRRADHIDSPMYYFTLARLYYQAEKWKLARQNYKKFLTWVRNPAWKSRVQEQIQFCTARLKSVK